MSVAFVKEPNEDQVETLPDRDLGTGPNLVTERGLALIDAAIAANEAGLAEARATGDKIAAATLNRDGRYWRARRATAQVTVPAADAETVQFGALVVIERDDGRRQSFRIVGIDEADPAAGLLSFTAPLARGLIGKGIGDTAKAGGTQAEIVSIAVE